MAADTCVTPVPDGTALYTFMSLLGQLRETHEAEIAALRRQIASLQAVEKEVRLPPQQTELMDTEPSAYRDVCEEDAVLSAEPHAEGESTGSPNKPLPATDLMAEDAPQEQRSSKRLHISERLQSAKTRVKAKAADKRMQKKRTRFKTNILSRTRSFPKPQQSKLGRMVNDPRFESIFALVIGLQALFMAAETQISGALLGEEVDFYEDGNHRTMFDALQVVFTASSWAFGIIYSVEVLLKVAALGLSWCRSLWNWFDLALIMLWIFEVTSVKDHWQLNLNLQTFRLLRLVRLFRLVKLARTIGAFDDLYLITTAFRGSLQVLGWTTVVFAMIQIFLAIGLTQILSIYIADDSNPIAERQEVFEYFGTFARSILTAFELTLGNWPPVIRILSENVSEWFIIFGIVHKITLGFALVGIINGVFIQETFKVANSDDTLMMKRKALAARIHREKMEALFEAYREEKRNENGDFCISRTGYDEIMREPDIKAWLSSMELEPRDIDKIFLLLDDAVGDIDGTITCEELIEGVAHLKGTARSLDLVSLHRDVTQIASEIVKLQNLALTSSFPGMQQRLLHREESQNQPRSASAPALSAPLQLGESEMGYESQKQPRSASAPALSVPLQLAEVHLEETLPAGSQADRRGPREVGCRCLEILHTARGYGTACRADDGRRIDECGRQASEGGATCDSARHVGGGSGLEDTFTDPTRLRPEGVETLMHTEVQGQVSRGQSNSEGDCTSLQKTRPTE